MINFNIKDFRLLILFFLIILISGMSCQDSSQKQTEPHRRTEFNSYKLFEEPSTKEITSLQFYFLAAAWGSFENTYILSIRKDSSNNSYGYYKVIDRDLMPPIANAIKTDTFPFIYSTTYFKLKASDIDTLQMLIREYKISTLKDTTQVNHLDGRSREVIVFDRGKLFNVFRSYGSETSIEKNYFDFLNRVAKKFTPPAPIPYFQR